MKVLDADCSCICPHTPPEIPAGNRGDQLDRTSKAWSLLHLIRAQVFSTCTPGTVGEAIPLICFAVDTGLTQAPLAHKFYMQSIYSCGKLYSSGWCPGANVHPAIDYSVRLQTLDLLSALRTGKGCSSISTGRAGLLQ